MLWIFAPEPLALGERLQDWPATDPQFSPPHFVHGFIGILEAMKLVKHDLGVAAMLGHPVLVGLAHVHARLGDGVPMTIVLFQGLDEMRPRFLVLAFHGKKRPLAH